MLITHPRYRTHNIRMVFVKLYVNAAQGTASAGKKHMNDFRDHCATELLSSDDMVSVCGVYKWLIPVGMDLCYSFTVGFYAHTSRKQIVLLIYIRPFY